MERNPRTSSGFTLIELMVVVSIIGILVSIGLVSLNGAKESARDSRRMADIAQIRLALELYSQDYNSYPTPSLSDAASMVSSVDAEPGTIFSTSLNPLVPTYLSRVIVDPVNNGGLHYWYDTNQLIGHRGYVLCFRQEGKLKLFFNYYSTNVYGYGDSCQSLP
ncbi:MAG: prepilin-type N-terminal cleavage/methylation domain-containing protein [Patescibacteria group bacterium]